VSLQSLEFSALSEKAIFGIDIPIAIFWFPLPSLRLGAVVMALGRQA
jgi:hypothetical protein